MGNYWLHRISNCWSVAKPLFDKGILTIGWQSLCKDGVLEAAEDWEKYNVFTKDHGQNSRSRWALYNFAHMEKGDTVVVPLYDKEFAIVEIESGIQKISDLPEEYIENLPQITLKDGFLRLESDGMPIDIGFFCKTSIPKAKPREYAENELRARMKIRQTNAEIGDISKLVDNAREAVEPSKPFNELIGRIKIDLIKQIREKVDPGRFEEFICILMEKLGASSTEVLAKNEPGKKDGADADVVAEFDKLGIKIYIQAKCHKGVTKEWAVKQIEEYSKQKGDEPNGRTLYWVISTADEFEGDAQGKAEESKIRLINGSELADMILSVGIGDLKDFF